MAKTKAKDFRISDAIKGFATSQPDTEPTTAAPIGAAEGQPQTASPPAPQNGYVYDVVLTSVDKLTEDEIKIVEAMGARFDGELLCASTAGDLCVEIQRVIDEMIKGRNSEIAHSGAAAVPVFDPTEHAGVPVDSSAQTSVPNAYAQNTAKKGRGRPKKENTKSCHLHLLIYPHVYQEIEECAKKQDISVNMFVTSAIAKAIDGMKKRESAKGKTANATGS